MKSLFNITAEALQLASDLEEGEITAELETSLVINQEELQQKAINYAYIIKTVEYDISAIDEELKRLQAVKKAKNNVIDRMKESVVNAMGIYGMEKISSPTMNLSLRRSESVEVDLTEALPDDFKITKTTVTPDKVAIKQAIKQGENITGATLKVNYSLQIK
jgi:lipopolysaccharide biosynthesis protein